jgi:hypothetical protein
MTTKEKMGSSGDENYDSKNLQNWSQNIYTTNNLHR